MMTQEEAVRAYQKAHPFLLRLKRNNKYLTYQQYKTLRGQALSGDIEGACKGLERILMQKE